MKKKIALLLGTLIVLSALNPAFGQFGKKKKKLIEVTDTSGRKAVIETTDPEIEKTPEKPTTGAPAGSDLEKVIKEVQTLKNAFSKIEKKTSNLEKKVNREKKSILDSLREERKRRELEKVGMSSKIDQGNKELLGEIMANAKSSDLLFARIEARADSGDAEAENILKELDRSSDKYLRRFILVIGLILVLGGILGYLLWKSHKEAKLRNNFRSSS